MKLNRVGLVVHEGKDRAVHTAQDFRRWAHGENIDVLDLDVWAEHDSRTRAEDDIASAGPVDLIITIGGDGTFLRGVAAAKAADAPILGVDVGRLGFLTEVDPDQLITAVQAIRDGRADEEERLTLTMTANRPLDIPDELSTHLRFGRGPALPPPAVRAASPDDVGWGVELDVTALNDVVFEKLSRDRQASLGVYFGSRLFMTYSADALVVATPTGSTAYSFSAGGPVVSPRARAVIFTPVAAHMAFGKSIILGADELISVRVLERSGRVAVSVDGQIRGILDPGDWVSVFAQPWSVRLIRLHEADFYGRVRDRFGLSDAPAARADGELPPTYLPDERKPAALDHINVPTIERP